MATLKSRIPPFLISLMAGLPAASLYAGTPQCLSPTVEIYTTQDLYLEEGGAALNGCVRDFFPAPPAYIAGWTVNEGNFGFLDPQFPEGWNSLDGLALAIETCYQVRTYPFFPPGTCGLPLHPKFEGEFHPSGLIGRAWVMRWYLVCGSPEVGVFEFSVPIVRQNFCLDLFRDGFEN